MQAVDGLADQQRDDDRTPGRNHGRGVSDEQVGDDDGEGGDDHQQQHEDDDEEQVAPAFTDITPGQRADGLAAVALRGPQDAHVVHAGYENGAQGDPQECRQPAPNDGDGRADDGSGTGNRGEVVAPEHELVRRHVVDAVVHGVCWGFIALGKLEDAFAEEFRVDEVSTDDHRESDDH